MRKLFGSSSTDGTGSDGRRPFASTVWYGTNRRQADPSDPVAGYSCDRDDTGTVHYGRCRVSIPRTHRFGSAGSAWWQRWLTGTDDRLRLVERAELARDGFWTVDPPLLGRVGVDERAELARDGFWTGLRDELARGDDAGRQVLAYLHGYRVSFDEAAIRAAQIGFDPKVPGPTASFSWPSKESRASSS